MLTVAEAWHPLVRCEGHRTPPATSWAASQGSHPIGPHRSIRCFPMSLAMTWLPGCPVGRWAGHRRWTGARIGGSGYSLKALYINSSRSRERLFLWTSAFSSTLARTCVAAKYVGRRAQSAGLADNNFRASSFCVDNCQVVPKICPELSTAAGGCAPWLVSWPCKAPSARDRPRKNPAFFVERRVGRDRNDRGI